MALINPCEQLVLTCTNNMLVAAGPQIMRSLLQNSAKATDGNASYLAYSLCKGELHMPIALYISSRLVHVSNNHQCSHDLQAGCTEVGCTCSVAPAEHATAGQFAQYFWQFSLCYTGSHNSAQHAYTQEQLGT